MLILRLKFEFLFWDTKNEHRGLLKILKEVGDDLKLEWILWNDFKCEGLRLY